MKKYIGKFIWFFCERNEINLGRFAPIVFGWMIGAKPIKVEKEDNGPENLHNDYWD